MINDYITNHMERKESENHADWFIEESDDYTSLHYEFPLMCELGTYLDAHQNGIEYINGYFVMTFKNVLSQSEVNKLNTSQTNAFINAITLQLLDSKYNNISVTFGVFHILWINDILYAKFDDISELTYFLYMVDLVLSHHGELSPKLFKMWCRSYNHKWEE